MCVAPRLTVAHREIYKKAALAAHQMVYKAVLNRQLPDLKLTEIICVDCGISRATQYDHRDYSKPLEVWAVCAPCNYNRSSAVLTILGDKDAEKYARDQSYAKAKVPILPQQHGVFSPKDRGLRVPKLRQGFPSREVTCARCSYRWYTRIPYPKACVRCKSRMDWPK